MKSIIVRIQDSVCRSLGRFHPAASPFAVFSLAMLLYCGLGIPRAVADTGTLYSLADDAEVNRNYATGDLTVARQTSTYNKIGGYGTLLTGTQSCVVYMFQIPSVLLTDPSQEFTAANFSVRTGYKAPMTVNADLYGIGFSTSPSVLTTDYYQGALDTSCTLIQDNFLTPVTSDTTVISSTNAALLDYVNAQLRAARAANASSAYVFFRINTDSASSWNSYQVSMNEAGGSATPSLSYTTAPISDWTTVPLGGGGFVVGLTTDPSGSAVYCHTDVGGAFRWQYDQWVCITDTLVSGTLADCSNLVGVASLAIDPNNANQLYIAVGSGTSSTLPHGIFSSSDQGHTWTKINSTIMMHANGEGKSCGSRLAVDPNNPNVVWYGSNKDGLQKGVCSSGTWTWTQIPSTSVPFGQVSSGGTRGVSFVACDKNGGNTIVYAGVYDNVGTTGGVYMSTDGTNWSKVSGVALATPVRGQVASNGTLYVTCSNTTAGTVAKMLRSGTLAAITPAASINYVGLAVAQNDPNGNTVYVAQYTSGAASWGKIWRSVDGGSNWTMQYTVINNKNYTVTEPDGTPAVTRGTWFNSTSALLASSTNANQLWSCDYYGVTRTEDASQFTAATGAYWYSLQKGQEETCVMALKSAPSGAQLLSGVADVGGWRHVDTTVRPYGSGGCAFANPGGGSTTSLDFSENDTNRWARTWTNPNANGGSGGISRDGGATWLAFGQIASKTVINSSTAGWESWDLSTYLAKQKAKGVNTVTLIICSPNTPDKSSNILKFDSKDGGATNAPLLLVDGSTSIPCTADAYVSGSTTTTNYGTATDLQVAYAYGTTALSRWTYLKFDLSSVSSITTASLQLHRQSAANSTQFTAGVYVCTNTSWVESTITWANKPGPLTGSSDPILYPNYYDGATALMGGRIAISATNSNSLVWLPEGTANVPRYSVDGGVTWTASGTGSPTSMMTNRFVPSVLIQQLAADRVNGKFYLAKFGGVSGGNHAIYTSTNGGMNWVLTGTCATSSYNVYRAQIVAAPAANDVWISDDGVNSNGTAGGVWRSTNGGATWTKQSSGVITGVRQVAFGKPQSGTGYTVFINGYKNGVKGVYRSDDYCATWVMLDVPPTISSIDVLAGDRQTYGRVYIGTSGRGIFQTP